MDEFDQPHAPLNPKHRQPSKSKTHDKEVDAACCCGIGTCCCAVGNALACQHCLKGTDFATRTSYWHYMVAFACWPLLCGDKSTDHAPSMVRSLFHASG